MNGIRNIFCAHALPHKNASGGVYTNHRQVGKRIDGKGNITCSQSFTAHITDQEYEYCCCKHFHKQLQPAWQAITADEFDVFKIRLPVPAHSKVLVIFPGKDFKTQDNTGNCPADDRGYARPGNAKFR